jgi:hypothetical protein
VRDALAFAAAAGAAALLAAANLGMLNGVRTGPAVVPVGGLREAGPARPHVAAGPDRTVAGCADGAPADAVLASEDGGPPFIIPSDLPAGTVPAVPGCGPAAPRFFVRTADGTRRIVLRFVRTADRTFTESPPIAVPGR